MVARKADAGCELGGSLAEASFWKESEQIVSYCDVQPFNEMDWIHHEWYGKPGVEGVWELGE